MLISQAHLLLILSFVSLVLAGSYHSLSDDGGASFFDHFGTAFRFPPKLLPVLILADGAASGAVSNYLAHGDAWTSVFTALSAAAAGLFGAVGVHAMQNKTPPRTITVSSPPTEVKVTGEAPSAAAHNPTVPTGSVAMRLAVAAMFIIMVCAGCASATQALTNSCLAVKIADDACAVIEVPGPDGGAPTMVKVSGKDLREFGARKAAEHADAGAP
jgi:hypothetical protein